MGCHIQLNIDHIYLYDKFDHSSIPWLQTKLLHFSFPIINISKNSINFEKNTKNIKCTQQRQVFFRVS